MIRSKTSSFTSDKNNLKDLLDNIQEGSIQLPDFQRGWVWDDEHIRDLIVSISLSYPVGTIMLLETGGEDVRFKPRSVEGVLSSSNKPEYLILDGQQRLTSLFQTLLSQMVVKTRNARKRPIERWYYFDIQKAVNPNFDRDEAIISLPEDRQIKNFRGEITADYSKPEKEYEAGIFPLNQLFDSATWRWGYSEYWNHSPEKAKLFDNFDREIISRFTHYQIPVILVNKQTPKEAVCQVFEKVNTGGVTLTVFELLTANFAADDYSLRDDWKKRHKNFSNFKVLDDISSTDFLMSIALLVTYSKRQQFITESESEDNAPGVSCKRKDILRLTVNQYREWADDLSSGFEKVVRFLHRQKIFTNRDIPYRTQIVPLAAIMTILGDKADSDGVQNKLSQWYWCGVLGELYGSAVESRFARDLPEVIEWITQHGAIPKTIDDANFVPERLITLRTRNSAAYKGIHTLLMRDGCLDFRTGETIESQTFFDDNIDIHHIFPRDWCDNYGIDKGQRDCIINKTPISGRTNRTIGGKSPDMYLEQLRQSASISSERMNTILKSHLIEPDTLRSNDFDRFFVHRQMALLNRIEAAMGKSVLSDKVSSELIMEDDYEGKETEAAV